MGCSALLLVFWLSNVRLEPGHRGGEVVLTTKPAVDPVGAGEAPRWDLTITNRSDLSVRASRFDVVHEGSPERLDGCFPSEPFILAPSASRTEPCVWETAATGPPRTVNVMLAVSDAVERDFVPRMVVVWLRHPQDATQSPGDAATSSAQFGDTSQSFLTFGSVRIVSGLSVVTFLLLLAAWTWSFWRWRRNAARLADSAQLRAMPDSALDPIRLRQPSDPMGAYPDS